MYTPQRDDSGPIEAPLIPPVAQPRGLQFFGGTWTGRIILINTFVFLITAYLSPDYGLFSVDLDVLKRFGAKDPVLIAQGQYWRLITPMFIHGGFLHFALNNWALYVLGFQLESLLSPYRYLLLYLLAGIGGSVASSVSSLMPSVGASGALFGLLGCGFYVERIVQARIKQMTGYKPRTGAYTGMVVANILFGFIIPQIDNAAHMGGLVVGVTFAYVLLRVKPNRLLPLQPTQGWLVAILLGISLFVGGAVGSSPRFVLYRLRTALENSQRVEDQYYYLNRLLEMDPEDQSAHLYRLKLALRGRDFATAEIDLTYILDRQLFRTELKELELDLLAHGLQPYAAWLQQKILELESKNVESPSL